MSALDIGTAHSQPGQIVYGTFEAIPHPTGGMDHLPVIIAQGASDADPVLWVTANIHGAEYNGLAAIHQLITPELVAQLTGSIIAIPTLNPAGLRAGQRSPHYMRGRDPNRLFPNPTQPITSHTTQAQSTLETVYAHLFERIDATADILIDLHDYGIEAIPFVFRDPVFYREHRDRAVAMRLQDKVGEMVRALGLTVVNEFASDDYLKLNLHRSVSGAVLNAARIPAVTIEIGGQQRVNPVHVRAVVSGIRNVMRWAGMLPGALEPIQDVPVIDLGYPVRRTTHPRVPVACILHYLVRPGDLVKAADPVARMMDIYGRPVGTENGYLLAGQDGFIIGLYSGIACYPNDTILGLAVRDTSDPVILLPKTN